MRLFLIRHGQTPHNVTGALDTASPGADLTPLGQAQAEAIPRVLAGEEISSIHGSRLIRTQLTAAPLADSRGLDVAVRPGLEEVSAGDLELRSDHEAVLIFTDCVASWMRGDLERSVPGGETGRQFYARYDAALRAIAAQHGPDDTAVVFSHGAAIRAYTTLAVGLDPVVWVEMRIMNTGMGLLEGDPTTGWELTRWSSEPLGGLGLEDFQAHDVTGEASPSTSWSG